MKIETLEEVISQNEKVLWEGAPSKKGVRKYFLNVLMYILLIVISYLILLNLLALDIINNLALILVLILIIQFLITIPIITNIIYYRELNKTQYYLTNKKEFDVQKEGKSSKEVYQSLNFEHIYKIVITPLKEDLAHVDFYSNYIAEEPFSFYYAIRKISLEDGNTKPKKQEYTYEFESPKKEWKSYQGGEYHRFFYVENYKEIEKLLRRLGPKMVKINKNRKKKLLILPRK